MKKVVHASTKLLERDGVACPIYQEKEYCPPWILAQPLVSIIEESVGLCQNLSLIIIAWKEVVKGSDGVLSQEIFFGNACNRQFFFC